MTALLMFRFLPEGFSNRILRETVARLLVRSLDEITPGQLTYQLRRLRLRARSDRADFPNASLPAHGNRTAHRVVLHVQLVSGNPTDACGPQ
jgi:hypothetical protein